MSNDSESISLSSQDNQRSLYTASTDSSSTTTAVTDDDDCNTLTYEDTIGSSGGATPVPRQQQGSGSNGSQSNVDSKDTDALSTPEDGSSSADWNKSDGSRVSEGDGSLCSANVTSLSSPAGVTEDEITSSEEETEDDNEDSSSCSNSTTVPRRHTTVHEHSAIKPAAAFITEPPLEGHDSLQLLDQQILCQRVENGDIDAVKHNLIQSGMKIESSCDQYKRTLLHIASSLGHLEIVKFLLMSGSPVDVSSVKGQTPLMEACIGGHHKIVQLLIPEVGDLDHVDEEGRSAAHYCALHGEVKCLNILCDHGIDICLEDTVNRNCVHYAAMKNHSAIIQCLMERGAELETVDNKGQTPAHYAVKYNSLACLEVLLHSAVDVTQGDISGTQPAHVAAYYDRLDCLKLLLRKGKVKCSDTDHKGRNALHKAAQGNATNCLHWMLSTGRMDPTSLDCNSGLHYSAMEGQSEAYHCLLRHDADDSCVNNEGLTPIDVARRHGKSLHIIKAIDGVINCPLCSKEESFKEKPYQTQVKKKIEAEHRTLFTTDKLSTNKKKQGKQRSAHSKTLELRGPSTSPTPRHLLAAKYYGPPYK